MVDLRTMQEIVRLVNDGLTVNQIAYALNLPEGMVEDMWARFVNGELDSACQ